MRIEDIAWIEGAGIEAGVNRIGITRGSAGCLKELIDMAQEYRMWLDKISTGYGVPPVNRRGEN